MSRMIWDMAKEKVFGATPPAPPKDIPSTEVIPAEPKPKRKGRGPTVFPPAICGTKRWSPEALKLLKNPKSTFSTNSLKRIDQILMVDGSGDMPAPVLAKRLGISTIAMKRWLQVPEVQAVIEYRKQVANYEAKKALLKRAVGFEKEQVKVFQYQGEPVIVPYKEYYPPETAALKEWLSKQDEETWGDRNKMQAALDAEMPGINITLNFAGDAPKTIDVTPAKGKKSE